MRTFAKGTGTAKRIPPAPYVPVRTLLKPAVPLQRACACGGGCPRCRGESAAPEQTEAPAIVHEVLRSPGRPLAPAARAFMEPRFGQDFGEVRIHDDSRAVRSCEAVNAIAYTVGPDIAFGSGRYAPQTAQGRWLLAHELAHVAQQQQGDRAPSPPTGSAGIRSLETQADRAADAVSMGRRVPSIGAAMGTPIQRRVEMRDVGRGERSGFARLRELVARLNAISQGLTFSMNGQLLAYEVRAGGTLSNFDRQMMGFIDQDPLIPFRLTNRAGLLGTAAGGFNDRVDVDAWTSGYVDVDDLLASTDLGLQYAMVHFLRERTATTNYARRMGTTTFTLPEFNRVHRRGIEAETELLRDYFGDPTIRVVNDSPSATVVRVFRNSRRDLIRSRLTRGRGDQRGVDPVSIDVRTRAGEILTAEEYRRRLRAEGRPAGG